MVHGLETMRKLNEDAANKATFTPDECQLRAALAYIERLKTFARQEMHSSPSHISQSTLDLNRRLIAEEAREFDDACTSNDFTEYLDGLGDIIYVALGAIMSVGVDPAEVLRRICVSNDTKLGADATIKDGKLIKSASYTPVDLSDLATNNNRLV